MEEIKNIMTLNNFNYGSNSEITKKIARSTPDDSARQKCDPKDAVDVVVSQIQANKLEPIRSTQIAVDYQMWSQLTSCFIQKMKLPRALIEELRKAEQRPIWESRNEGVHERVNFDDTIWGFSLAGGAFYNTPLRVTKVKEGSRAEYAGIKVGDFLKSINEVDTSTLTIQQAHDLILKSGLEIKFALSAPDVEETMHYVYQDYIEDTIEEKHHLRELKLRQEQRLFKGAKTNNVWSMAWPCSKKRDILYRESNCFLVPSRHELRLSDRILMSSGDGRETAKSKNEMAMVEDD